jgi:arylsulfatase A-like enzyme
MKKTFRNVLVKTAFVAAASFGLSVGGFSPKAEAFNEMPNVVVIYVDDMGYGDSTLTNPSATVNTPNIKSIGDNGVNFTNGYDATPVCSPSRGSLMTSRNPASYDADNNAIARANPDRLPADTIASLLAAKNYNTMIVGKWDLGLANTYMPIARGFQGFYGIPGGISSYYRTDGTAPSTAWYYDASTGTNINSSTVVSNQTLNVKEYVGGTPPYVSRNPASYLTNDLTDHAITYIDSQSGTTTNPFFLYLSYNSPHVPYMVPDSNYQKYASISDPYQRIYAAMIDNLDEQVGRVLTELSNKGFLNNTLVIFASDNGAAGAGSSGVLNGGKHDLFEGGIHAAFAMQWPAKFTAGTVYTEPVSTLDILPTIAVAGGYSNLANLNSIDPVDGVNLTPYILNTITGNPHDELEWRYVDDNVTDNAIGDKTAVRSGDYKYIKEVLQDHTTNAVTTSEYLFNLSTDLGETTNLASDPSYAATKSSLISKLNTWNSSNPLNENFDKFDATSKDGWMTYGGTWTATSGGKYQGVGSSGDKSMDELTYFDDFTYQADMTLTQAGRDGLIFRSTNDAVGAYKFNGYLAQLDSDTETVKLLRMDNGTSTQVASAAFTVNVNQSYHMKVVTSGSSIQVYVDNMTTPLINTTDSTYAAGSIGVRVGAASGSSTAQFDNIAVTK